MLIDFHTHTRASDGALEPRELVARAADRKVNLLAITDHDTVAGFQAAAVYHTENPSDMRLVPGIEFSCQWSGATIHILGLGVDTEHPVMCSAVQQMATARQERGVKIGARLASRGFPNALEGALDIAGSSQLGRPHFATWMVSQGYVEDHNQAFDRYLGQGKIGDVKAFWPQLAQVVEWINSTSGVAVIAHPLKYRFTGMKLRRLITDFVAAGGGAIEVLSGHQTRDQTRHLNRLAESFELEISVGSDFHREAPYRADLGVESSQFSGSRCVWDRWAQPK